MIVNYSKMMIYKPQKYIFISKKQHFNMFFCFIILLIFLPSIGENPPKIDYLKIRLFGEAKAGPKARGRGLPPSVCSPEGTSLDSFEVEV